MSDTGTATRRTTTLFDIVITLAENWLLLVAVPAVVAILTFFVVAAQPLTYRSVALVNLAPTTVSGEIEALARNESTPGSDLRELNAIADLVKITPGQSPTTSVLELQLADPAAADNGMKLILAELVKAVESGEIESPYDLADNRRQQLQADISIRDRMIGVLAELLEMRNLEAPQNELAFAQTASVLDQMLTSRDVQRDRWYDITLSLPARPSSIVGDVPSRPSPVEARSPLRMAAITAFCTVFILGLLVLVRQFLREAASDSAMSGKIGRLRDAFRLRGSIS